jgi:hypothetical protein
MVAALLLALLKMQRGAEILWEWRRGAKTLLKKQKGA